MKKYFALFMIFSFFSFQKKSEPVCEKTRLYEKADFPIGVAVNIDKLERDQDYRDLIISQFNSITAEKSMKPLFIHPKKDVYDFSDTDYLMEFCKKNNKRLHGHTLVWYKEVPKWMQNFKGDKKDWEEILKEHIQTVINHCKWYVRSWDVVNEAFNEDGSLRENIWLKNIGESYIQKSFMYAREADPTATLFYNDYDLESRPQKLNAVLKFLSAMRAEGVVVDGIGMQMHISVNYPYPVDINQAVIKAEQQGFRIHYSECDISLVRTGKLFAMKGQMLSLQKRRIKEIVTGYLQLNKASRFGITMWGVSDADTWLSNNNRTDRPLLFDENYKVKPAYCGFLEALTE